LDEKLLSEEFVELLPDGRRFDVIDSGTCDGRSVQSSLSASGLCW